MKIPVRIADIQEISPTVKSFTLALDGQPFTFLPGQWIDCFIDIDGKTEVAGYSITSSPTEDGWFSIAVKLVGDSAVTDYLHDSAAVGDSLIVEGGQGDFHYAGNDSHPLAFIAGGIGITPIASIIRYIDNSALKVPATLVYSASVPSELLFCEEFKAIEARNPHFRARFSVTRPHSEPWSGRTGRIDATTLQDAGIDANTFCYLCGPPEMIRAMLVRAQRNRRPSGTPTIRAMVVGQEGNLNLPRAPVVQLIVARADE